MLSTCQRAAKGIRRDRALDGLRGVAAFVVLLDHSLLTSSALAIAYSAITHVSGWARWLTDTPLHTLWDGPQAVYVFFLLSGFVVMPRGAPRASVG
jgi:peptidoglycan/LPS O-acetylase OafA/YrhL